MAEIRHRVGIAASPAQLYKALTTTDGLANWWTRDAGGDARLHGTLHFFGNPHFTDGAGIGMEVAELIPDQRVVWRCTQGPEGWLGTTVTFDLQPGKDETVLRFTHGGWREPTEFMGHCSTKWAIHLLGLKTWLEGAKPTPYPDEPKISHSVWG